MVDNPTIPEPLRAEIEGRQEALEAVAPYIWAGLRFDRAKGLPVGEEFFAKAIRTARLLSQYVTPPPDVAAILEKKK